MYLIYHYYNYPSYDHIISSLLFYTLIILYLLMYWQSMAVTNANFPCAGENGKTHERRLKHLWTFVLAKSRLGEWLTEAQIIKPFWMPWCSVISPVTSTPPYYHFPFFLSVFPLLMSLFYTGLLVLPVNVSYA